MKIEKYRYSFAGEVYQIPVLRIAVNKARGLYTSGEYSSIEQAIKNVLDEFDMNNDEINEWALEMGVEELVKKSRETLFCNKDRKALFQEHSWDIA